MKPEVQHILLKQPEHKLQQLLELRDCVMQTDTTLTEGLKFGRITFFSNGKAIAFICSKAETDYTELGFFNGASLTDPEQMLQGKNGNCRRLRMYAGEKLPVKQIRKWVKEAIK
jgi:hypothetical protein